MFFPPSTTFILRISQNPILQLRSFTNSQSSKNSYLTTLLTFNYLLIINTFIKSHNKSTLLCEKFIMQKITHNEDRNIYIILNYPHLVVTHLSFSFSLQQVVLTYYLFKNGYFYQPFAPITQYPTYDSSSSHEYITAIK